MKTALFSGILFATLVGTVLSQTCDPTSDVNACIGNEVCRTDTCVQSTSCDNNRECSYAGDACVDSVCQPEMCSAQGQCAGHDWYRCSNDSTTRRCVDTWDRSGRTGREARIYFGIVPYDSLVKWYKHSRHDDNLIITKDTVTGETIYYNEWCDGTSSCTDSEKGDILSYGWLRIFDVEPSDEGFYFFNQIYTFGKEDPGYDYQIYFTVNNKSCSSDDNSACWWDEVCRSNECVKSERCTSNNDTYCSLPGDACVSTYCQPEFCTASGDCARFKTCTSDTSATQQRCVRSSITFGREDRERRLYLPDWEPFSEIRWYKNTRDNMIVSHAENVTWYHDDWCTGGAGPCNSSTKGELEEDGDLTLFSMELDDGAVYFYNLNTTNGKDDPGLDFQIDLRILENKCNTSIDSNQCYWDEICRGETCVTATKCESDVNCTITGEKCISEYCMPEFCDADNQCAAQYSYKCSEDTVQRCVRSSYYFTVREGREARLSLPEKVPYTNITWHKGNRDTGKIAHQDASGVVTYYGDYCNGTASCTTSSRGRLDPTGYFAILRALLTDSGNYYYNLGPVDGTDDPGLDYQLVVRVYEDFAPTSQCGGELTASTGTIKSVNFPSDYRNYLKCYWTLNIPRAAGIVWEFKSFDLEACCGCDFVEFADSSGKLLHKFCQGNHSTVEFSTPNDVKVSFISDFTINRPGFELTWAQDGTVTTLEPTTPKTTIDPGTTPSHTDGPTTTPGDSETTTTDNGSTGVTPGKFTLLTAIVLVLAFKW